MKKLKVAILVVAMLAVLVGCGGENKAVDATPTPEQTEKQALPDTLNDGALMACASAALSEIGVYDAEFLVSSDTNTEITHDVRLETTYEDIPLTVSCFSVDGEWYAISIYSEETKKYYWADDDVRVFQDIYNLKTGKLISAKSKEIEDGQKELEERADKAVADAKSELEKLSISIKFQNLGFTEEEATEIADIFLHVGLTDIGKITPDVGSGIDKLQAFIIPVFGSEQLQANIAVENRKLCSIELAGIGAYEPEFYISVFGNVKAREKQAVKTVLLFDRWDGDAGKEIADSYAAKIDYENMEIVNFK